MGTDLDGTNHTIREAIIYALECGVKRDDLEVMLTEITTDVRHKRELLPLDIKNET